MNDKETRKLQALGYFLGDMLKTNPEERQQIKSEMKIIEKTYKKTEWKTIKDAIKEIY